MDVDGYNKHVESPVWDTNFFVGPVLQYIISLSFSFFFLQRYMSLHSSEHTAIED